MSNINLIKSSIITYNDLFEYVIDKICSTCENISLDKNPESNYDLSKALNEKIKEHIKNNVSTAYNNGTFTCSYTTKFSYVGGWAAKDSGGITTYTNNIKTNIKYNFSNIPITIVSKESIKKDLSDYLDANGISPTNIINFKTIMNFFSAVSIFLENTIQRYSINCYANISNTPNIFIGYFYKRPSIIKTTNNKNNNYKYNNIYSIDNIKNDLKDILASIYNENITFKLIEGTVSYSNCCSSSSSSCSSSSSSSSFILYIFI